MRARELLVGCSFLIAVACSSSKSGSGAVASDGGASSTTLDGADASIDAAGSDDASSTDASSAFDGSLPDGALIGACAVKRAKASSECTDDCDAHLQLPKANDWFCTTSCSAPTDCGGLPGIVCAPFGACVPSCKADAECKAAGFLRCDTSAGACDTI